MLVRLEITDIVLVSKLDIGFGDGLTVFTGETGAGKSILLDSLGLATGSRADAGLVRTGARQGSAAAEFAPPFPSTLHDIIDDHGIILNDDESVVLRRVVGRDGKSRAFINDQSISAGLMRRIGDVLLSIEGQFASQYLTDPAHVRTLLDAAAGTGKLVSDVSAAWHHWQQCAQRLFGAKETLDKTKSDADFLRAELAVMDNLAPYAGESESLEQRRAIIRHSSRIDEALSQADKSLNDSHGARDSLRQAARSLGRIADKLTEATALLATLDRLADEAAEAGDVILKMRQSLLHDPEEAQRIEDRLYELRAAARRHSTQPDNLHVIHNELRERLNALEDKGESITLLEKEVEDARSIWIKNARTLHDKRIKAAQALAKRVRAELPPLKLDRTRFEIAITELPIEQGGAHGIDNIEFRVAINPGQELGSLSRVASGGELARITLALRVVMADSESINTIVFDEIDSGIGGATAAAVGARLSQLASTGVQVIVVTHSPQIAARGANHMRVLKQTDADGAHVEVESLNNTAARVDEIARMLAGNVITPAARSAAKSLLKG